MAIKNVYSTAAGNGSNGNKKNSTTYVDKTGTYKLTGGAGNERAYTNVDPNADYKRLFTNPTAGTTTYYTGASLAGPSDYVAPADNKFNSGLFAGVTANTPEPATPSAPVYDASADLMAAYNARQAALQKNFDISREQLQKAYDDSVNALRTQGEDAMRQAYINMMMSKRGLGQSLEAAGLRGGATESALAGIYNNYANNRNSIARAIEEGLTNAGNVYGNNLANLGMQYNTNSADAMEDYQKQLINARQSLANTLAKTASNSRGTSTDVIAANLKNFVKSPVSARRYLSSLGITGSAADEYLWNAGIDPANTYEDAQSTGLNQDYVSILKNFRNDPESAKAYADSVGGLSDDYYWAAGINPNSTIIDPSLATTLVSDLNNVVAEANRHTRNENLIEQSLANRMRELAAQYGLTEEQARYILAQAGY